MHPGAAASAIPAEQLRDLLRDLLGLLALPAMCHGQEPRAIATAILDVLATLIPHRRGYIRITKPTASCEVVRPSLDEPQLAALRDAVAERGRVIDTTTIAVAHDGQIAHMIVVPIGFFGDAGVMAFVTETPCSLREHVVLRATAALASTALENALLLAHVRDADRRKDEFIAVLGHELRNPLAPILSSLELLGPVAGPTAAAYEVIERSTRHMMRLVDDLLDVSRIARGMLALTTRDVAMVEVLSGAVELAAPLVEQAGHSLSLSLGAGAYVHGDPTRLTQLFSNILTNAARYTDAGGTITVTSALDGDRVRVSVRDNGRGIAPELTANIFEPFVQIDRRTTARGGGLGLGLTLVKRLTELHGGRVQLHSAGLGMGTEVTIELPAIAKPTQASRAAPPAGRASPRALRVLVVDDNVDAAGAIAKLLETRGHTPYLAHTGTRALEVAASEPIDVAILDIGLPDVDGDEVARTLRQRHPTIRLIALTGFSQRRAGFDHYVVKPVEFHTLVELLERA